MILFINMKNLIPKSLAKQKAIVYKNISWYDVIYFLVSAALCFGIFLPITAMSIITRIVIATSIFLPTLFLLIYLKNHDARLYVIVWRWLKFLINKKIYSGNETKNLNPYLKINNHNIITKKSKEIKSYNLKVIKIRGLDITSLSDEEAEIKLSQFHSFIVNQKGYFSIAKISGLYEFDSQIKNIKNEMKMNKEKYDNALISEKEYLNKMKQQQDQIQTLKEPDKMLESNFFAKNFYFIIYEINEEILKTRIKFLEDDLNQIGLWTNILDEFESINFIKNIYNPLQEDISNEVIKENAENLDEIFSLESAKIKSDHIILNDELFLSFQSISDYPIEIDNYWLANIFLISEANIIMNVKELSHSKASSLINKAIVNSSANQYNEKKEVQKREFDVINEGFVDLADQLIKNEQVIKTCNILFLNYDTDKKSLIKSNRMIEKKLKPKGIKINRLKHLQFDALSAFLPKPNDPLEIVIAREMPSKTIANGYPFINSSIDDKKGMPLGSNWIDDPILFDQFVLDENRKNHNMMIIGSSGSGKSYLTKKIINWHQLTNKKIFILDVEREYKNITQYYDGDWIDVGSGTFGKINPLEIFAFDGINSAIVSNHLLILESFFKILFHEISSVQIRYLTTCLKSFYKSLNFFDAKFNFNKTTSKDFPIFEEFYKFIISNKNKENIKLYSIDDVNFINELIRSEFGLEGKLSFLYNGHSTISTSKQISCFDINSLFEKNNERITQAQLFLLLNYIQREVNQNDYNSESIIIVIDEAHLLVDKDNPVGLDFIFQMVKRIRKRNGGIILITQNPDDFVGSPEVAKKTKAILNNTQYSFFFNLSPNNIKDISDMYKSYGSGLSDDEKLYIAKARRGEALFLVSGFDRHKIKVHVSEAEKESFNYNEDNIKPL